jgi:hypothetical protein
MLEEDNVTLIDDAELPLAEDDFYAEEDQVFEGGPSRELVNAWKQKYGQVFLTEIDNAGVFVWRVLTRKELREMAKTAADEMTREETVCELCTLWPQGVSFAAGLAGTSTILSDQIFTKSGYQPMTAPIAL